MKFSFLAAYLQKLEATSSRNEITQILAELFTKSDSSEIDEVVYLLLGKLAPNYQGVIFSMADKMMLRTISLAYNLDLIKVIEAYKAKGDLGDVAEKLSKNIEKNLTVKEVFAMLIDIASDSGKGSQERKVRKLADLLENVSSLSARYIARIPVEKLRIGFSNMTILDALSFMLKGDKTARKEIETAFNVFVDIGKIAKIIKEKGLAGIKKILPEPGVPIRPSLAERLPSAEKILEKVGPEVIVEPKYDGFRAQVHINNGQVNIFSRNLERTTSMFPDLVAAVKKIKVKSAIFDGEAIGYDPKNNKFLPFQETVQRKRKHGVEAASKKLPLRLFIFDILYKDGRSLLNLPFSERRKILESLKIKNSRVEITRQNIVTDPNEIRDLISKYLREGLEGALIKKIDAPYKAGARGYHWVKYKKTTVEGVADTIDCLVMGVYKGKGKRASFGTGAFLAGVYDSKGGGFKTVSKIGTGLTDEQWRELDRRTKKIATREQSKEFVVEKNLYPDLWVKPSLVVEILADEITRSPLHSAGLALRFPRLIRFRDEKNPEDVTNIKELKKLFEMQKV